MLTWNVSPPRLVIAAIRALLRFLAGEIFPLEVRGQAISYFFAISQVVGSMGPLIFANFVGNGTDRVPLFWGYVLGSGVMIFGGLVAWFFGVNAEGKGLEEISAPLTSVKTAPA